MIKYNTYERGFNMYKKLFDFKYMNEIYTIFLTPDYKKIVFKKDNSNYLKLDKKLFNYFYQILNCLNIDIVASLNDEKRAFIAISLTLCILISEASIVKKCFQDNSEPNISISENVVNKTIIFNNLEELKSTLNLETPTINEVHNNIDNNNYLDENIKNMAHNIVDYLYNNFNYDLTVFNENIQTLKIIWQDMGQIKAEQGASINGYYIHSTNEIVIPYNCKKSTLYHELMHTTSIYNHISNNCKYLWNGYLIKNNTYIGRYLDEAMNTRLTNELKISNSYEFSSNILDYLLKSVDYSFEEYNKYGIAKYIELLETKYPQIDIKKIAIMIDTYYENVDNKEFDLIDAKKSIIDALFEICLANIDKNNLFASLDDFAYLIDYETYEQYLKLYLEELNKLGYANLSIDDIKKQVNEKIEPLKQIKEFIYYNKYIYPIIKEDENTTKTIYTFLNEKLEEKYLSLYYGKDFSRALRSSINFYTYYEYFEMNVKDYAYMHLAKIATQDFWHELTLRYEYFYYHQLNDIALYYQDKLIGKYNIYDLNVSITLDEFNNLGFNLIYQNQIIFSTSANNNYIKQTTPIPLKNYCIFPFDENLNEFNLQKYFNVNYLIVEEEKFNSPLNIEIGNLLQEYLQNSQKNSKNIALTRRLIKY